MKTCLFLLFLSVALFADVSDYAPYFEKAGSYYNIPPILLQNIAVIESGGNPSAIRINDNGTKDYGLMQINSIHFRQLSLWGINEGNILNPKINIYAASWLLSGHIKERGFNLQAIGNYHSKTKLHKDKWLRRLTLALKSSQI
ncbi:MAG: lytic transglycosylase domain-containing protein [Sulfuricurvum sp.]|uniref:lytic transglycosylase domain-containing protein n=1 Tax=Sulfuricurvum sp. TaxID=2025608 RepID=UPI0027242B6E|nr:lytic transglycosylase domain-containing protein [Sulfuricurvum sp.]MDO9055792.1 lytic transglycosylase domain-containing protein [Sulfuricurvum sp.]MDP2851288.1 lytic transglycosylase domain-containing protein [Sulfuricurvum sp.]MDP3292874.1 lytic transglycosylase domain-containing protein [Sulfuricurvum sp.]